MALYRFIDLVNANAIAELTWLIGEANVFHRRRGKSWSLYPRLSARAWPEAVNSGRIPRDTAVVSFLPRPDDRLTWFLLRETRHWNPLLSRSHSPVVIQLVELFTPILVSSVPFSRCPITPTHTMANSSWCIRRQTLGGLERIRYESFYREVYNKVTIEIPSTGDVRTTFAIEPILRPCLHFAMKTKQTRWISPRFDLNPAIFSLPHAICQTARYLSYAIPCQILPLPICLNN